MAVKVYWSPEYFYAVAVEGEYEYMPYEEYLMIRDEVPGYAVVFRRSPKIVNGKLHTFRQTVFEINRVEKLSEDLYKIKVDNGFTLLTDGSLYLNVKEDVIKFFEKEIGLDGLKILADYTYTNASSLFYKDGKIIAVYQDLYLKVNPKTCGIENADEERTIVRVIDFNTVPTTEKVYTLLGGGDYRYCGRKYVKEVPLHDYRVGDERGVGIRSEIGIPFTKIVRVKGGKIEVVEKLFSALPSGWDGLTRRHSREIPLRPGTIFMDDDIFGWDVKAIIVVGGKVYYVSAPLNAYLHGSEEFLIQNFGKELPLVYRNGTLFVDFSAVEPAEKRERMFRKIRVRNKVLEDRGYLLYDSDLEVVYPLVRTDLRKRSRSFAILDYDVVERGEFPGRGFFISNYDVFYDSMGKPKYSVDSFGFGDVAIVGDYVLPWSAKIVEFVEKYYDYVRGVYYFPEKDGYSVYVDFGKFFVGFEHRLRRGTTVVFPELRLALDVDDRNFSVDRAEFGFTPASGYRNIYSDGYVEVTVQGGRVVEKRFVKENYRWSKGGKRPIYYPVKSSGYTYHDCGIYLTIGKKKKVLRVRDVCIPEVFSVKKVKKKGDCYCMKIVHKKTGERLEVEVYGDGYCVVNAGDNSYEFDLDSLYGVLELIDAYGSKNFAALL